MYSNLKVGTEIRPFHVKLDVFRYVDALIHSSLRETVLDGLVHIQQKYKVHVHGWIVMPSSVRIIVSATVQDQELEAVVEGFMNYTDPKLFQNIHHMRNEIRKSWMLQVFEGNRKNRHTLFWHGRYTLESLETQHDFTDCINNMHEAPVMFGMVWDGHNYIYSSAIDYSGNEQGLLPIMKLKLSDGFF